MYYRPGAALPIGYLVYDRATDTVKEEASVTLGKTIYPSPPGPRSWPRW